MNECEDGISNYLNAIALCQDFANTAVDGYSPQPFPYPPPSPHISFGIAGSNDPKP